jgi:hypothetical protein
MLIFFLIFSVIYVYSQNEITPWEKLGISKTEWIMIQDNNISMNKVAELLGAGIGIGEYIEKPWIGLNMTESKWISKRRSGLTNEEIKNKVKNPASDSSWTEHNKKNVREDLQSVSKNGEKFSSLLLPGYQQHKAGRKVSRNLMIGFAGASVAWCAAGSVYNKRFEFVPIFFITVPTMIWSFSDYSAHSKK